MIKPIIVSIALASCLATTVALAGSAVVLNDANTDQIRSLLAEQGYEVSKVKIEDGLYEAYARRNGERFEVFMDGDFKIVRLDRD